MAWGKKKDEDKKPSPKDVKWKKHEDKDSMWCREHECTKLACPGGNHN